jgi:hypothetical protein
MCVLSDTELEEMLPAAPSISVLCELLTPQPAVVVPSSALIDPYRTDAIWTDPALPVCPSDTAPT